MFGKRRGGLFRPAETKAARQARIIHIAHTASPSASRLTNRVKAAAAAAAAAPTVIPDDPPAMTQTKFMCTLGKNGSRLLTLDNYVVSFTNSVGGGADDAPMDRVEAAKEITAQGGFRSARSMVAAKKPKKEAPMNVVSKSSDKSETIVLDEAQERISKLDINKPLLIVAGAGSGKTTTLCARVLEIVKQGIDPARILVITFTNKAADELKARINRYMNEDLLTGGCKTKLMPHASTFHSWCYRLIADNFQKFGWKKCPLVAAATTEHEAILGIALDQIEDCRKLAQCEQMLGIVPPPNSSPANQSIYLDDAKPRWEGVIDIAKQMTGFNVDVAIRAVEKAQAEQEWNNKKGGRKSKLSEKTKGASERISVTRAVYCHLYAAIGKSKGLVDFEENKLELAKAFPGRNQIKDIMAFVYRAKSRGDTPAMYPLVERSILEAYNKTLESFGLMDFDDLLSRATELLQLPNVLESVQGQYPYLLVDEFQDLNQLQMRLVLQLQGDIGRVTAVGDERQSIYAFRGASCEHNFKTFLDHFVDAQVEKKQDTKGSMECLTRNYRSHQSIVDLGNIVAKDTIGDSELLGRLRVPLSAQPEMPTAPISVWDSLDIEQEASTIVRRIKSLLDKNECKPSDIAIILRCLDFGRYRPTNKIEIELLRNGIPYVVRGSQSVLKLKRMQTFMALIRVVANTDDDIAFSTCLDELVMDVGPVSKRKIENMNANDISPGSLFYRAECAIRTSSVAKHTKAGLGVFIANVRKWQTQLGTNTLMQILDSMYTLYIAEKEEEIEGVRTGHKQAAAHNAGDENSANEDRLWNMVLAIADSLKTPETIDDFSKPCSLERLNAFSAQLCMLSTATEDPGKVTAALGMNKARKGKDGQSSSAVIISTVHQAKGLEWEHVFVPHFIDYMFPMGFRGAPSADMAKATLDPVMKAELALAEKQHFREEGRLAYVAITRAKRGLYISVLEQYPQMWMKRFFGCECTQSRYLPGIMYSGKKKGGT
ncbi:hypothetical protein IW140_005306 [Coemansia sp. RSA 1813]|nr:hypothetical protein LPJ74_003698 [Coemansia sp. RSA 1843]KAJ2087040.1 hypothetical protein IW138_005259 [Coemansia sp. RSA 986]KAJ2211847.1 hypothetical protein EV179_005138 [Coemansia sp. RSA 487]KAJ2565498.1 hypothetical protein IW140_005306 [Coemansia sp. RSA 1813]